MTNHKLTMLLILAIAGMLMAINANGLEVEKPIKLTYGTKLYYAGHNYKITATGTRSDCVKGSRVLKAGRNSVRQVCVEVLEAYAHLDNQINSK
jgi:hypothetical protein